MFFTALPWDIPRRQNTAELKLTLLMLWNYRLIPQETSNYKKLLRVKEGIDLKIFTLCKPYLLSHKYMLITYVLLILLSTTIAVITPYIVCGFVDDLIEGADVYVILRFCAVFGGLSLIRIVKNYITAVLNVKMQTKMGYSLNKDAIQHIQSLSLSYVNKQDNAYLNQRVNNDANSLIGFCIAVLQSILTNCIILIATLAVLFTMNRFIAVLMMGFLVVYAISYLAFKKPLYTAGLAFRETQAGFFSKLFEQLKYIKLIKINSIQQEMNKRADDSFVGFNSAAVRNQKINYLYSGLDGFISTIAQIVLFVVGGLQILVDVDEDRKLLINSLKGTMDELNPLAIETISKWQVCDEIITENKQEAELYTNLRTRGYLDCSNEERIRKNIQLAAMMSIINAITIGAPVKPLYSFCYAHENRLTVDRKYIYMPCDCR